MTRQIPTIVIVLSKIFIDGSSRQSKKNLKTFLNLATTPKAKEPKNGNWPKSFSESRPKPKSAHKRPEPNWNSSGQEVSASRDRDFRDN